MKVDKIEWSIAKRWIKLILISLILFKVCLFCTEATLKTMMTQNKMPRLEIDSLLDKFNRKYFGYQLWAPLGLNNNYLYFAPGVGSECMVFHELKYKDNPSKNRTIADTLNQIESIMRYRNTFKTYYQLNSTEKGRKKMKKILMYFNRYAHSKYKADTITTSLYTLHIQPLAICHKIPRNSTFQMYNYNRLLDTTIIR
jgi:hypothetical protein